jgi:hypothetical protein
MSQGGAQGGEERKHSTSRVPGTPPGLAGELIAEQTQAEYCLGLLLSYPTTWQEVRAILVESDFAAGEARALYAAFAAAAPYEGALDAAAFQAALPEVLRELATHAVARVNGSLPDDEQAPMHVASQAAYRLKRMRIKAEVTELDFLQRDAEQAGDLETLRRLLLRKQQLLTQRRAIDAAAALIG